MAAGVSIFGLFRWFQRRSVGASLAVARVDNLLEVVLRCRPGAILRSNESSAVVQMFKPFSILLLNN